MQDNRPICATATAPGQGSIGVVRLSAPEPGVIEAVARAVCGSRLAALTPAAASGAAVSISGAAVGDVQDAVAASPLLSVDPSVTDLEPGDGVPATEGCPSVSSDRPAGPPIPGRTLRPRHATYGPFLAEDGQPIDYGLALWFPAPHSYTGEHVLELQGHGGPVVQQILLRRVLAVGAPFGIRLAEPGEFTERAFLNDKLDLVQAEAVADLIEASTEQAARSATRSLQGVFSDQIGQLAEQLLHLRMLVEATLDFPEEEIEFLERADAAGQLDAIDRTLKQLLATARSGARLRQGLNVVLTGAPNVGKSSLLNALAGAEVAIVTPIAGTTRDRVIEQISIEGVPINLIDTAGLRETEDVVERIGIERTWAEIAKADVVVHLRAVQKPPVSACAEEDVLIHAIESRIPTSARRLTVINKIDLLGQGGVLPAEASDRAGVRRHQADVSGGRASPSGQTGILVAEVDAEARLPGPTLSAEITGTDGRADAGATSDLVYLSARTGEGVQAFRQKLLEIAGFQPGAEGVFIARERHLQALQEALAHLDNARAHVAHGDQSLDLFAEELRLAHQALGRITGAVSADELLGVIFSRFCIGK
ncbi:MAG: tRNA uridine-5-carboxymethylaminomethyl(34) synthesis GTPase MnmE [Lautropia sp.]|nr:tRNA uridine-5-carboxymethylaminomethyl(34) synthesis GTPase MnmE [Lautropia sp.]